MARTRSIAGYAIPGIVVFFFWMVVVILAIIVLAFIVHWAGGGVLNLRLPEAPPPACRTVTG